MRDIKFRAWDKTTNKMVCIEEITFETQSDNPTNLPYAVNVSGNKHDSAWGNWRHLFHPMLIEDGNASPQAILMQFTGLRDKNGKEIYEGDIVHCQATFDNANMVVIFEEGEFHMVLCENYKDYIPLCGFYCIRNFTKEVIGNIHDNPELLEATAKEEMTNS